MTHGRRAYEAFTASMGTKAPWGALTERERGAWETVGAKLSAAEERKAVVAYLREMADDPSESARFSGTVGHLADAIENGEHLK